MGKLPSFQSTPESPRQIPSRRFKRRRTSLFHFVGLKIVFLYPAWVLYSIVSFHRLVPYQVRPNNLPTLSEVPKPDTSTAMVRDLQEPPPQEDAAADPDPPVLTAYLEPPRPRDITATRPLPVRTVAPGDLKEARFERVTHDRACRDDGADAGPGHGLYGGNRIAGMFPVDDYPDGDPFLPWIHDSFVTAAMTTAGVDYREDEEVPVVVRFVGQNRRRCDSRNLKLIQELEPQVALLQPVGVRKLEGSESPGGAPRYRLANHDDASDDGRFTRFICRFHVHDGGGRLETETLSTYPFNYEYANWRKRRETMLNPDGRNGNDNAWYWLATLIFDCPIPPDVLPHVVSDGAGGSTLTSQVYVDIVPIHTPARIAQQHFNKALAGNSKHTGRDYCNHDGRTGEDPQKGCNGKDSQGWEPFDADENWGKSHILPPVESSGRWANIPVCRPKGTLHTRTPSPDLGKKFSDSANSAATSATKQKPHTLVGCTWASSSFLRRGDSVSVGDGEARLKEWIAFHLLAGFDHLYIYDNSGVFTSPENHFYEGSGEGYDNLRSVTDLFGKDKVTWIEWPSKICNNNVDDKEGDRSSQYAAEASCRQRYGRLTDWMAFFDTDEYLVPMGNYTDMKDWLKNETAIQKANIFSYMSNRAVPRLSLMEPASDKVHPYCNKGGCYQRKSDKTFMQTYNCNRVLPPYPPSAEAKKKQIYRTDFVLAHFVHYTIVTQRAMRTHTWMKEHKYAWIRQSREDRKSERPTKEFEEALMVHSRTVKAMEMLLSKNKGIPWPNNEKIAGDDKHNCFMNYKIENYWVPLLEKSLQGIVSQNSS
uniref:Glycosyltransferase family 92 protein n=1 Tax=Corethron hystrix TaxID=216773 RepID=A0A7S1BNS3_9STRA|mmetsp:Transcript_33032/g.76125  ORF Transcript_33032/g.76125 Transcript_33032/m.76125 type:complete len:819 (+) Transcript_33032:137-2593(+)